MNVYFPSSHTDAMLPAIVYIHGGLPEQVKSQPKDWAVFESYGRLAAASGVIGITFSHRTARIPATLEQGAGDVLALLEFIRKNAAEFTMDSERICLWAFSAGGPYLSLPLRQRMPFIRCLVSSYAVLDLQSLKGAADTSTPDTMLTEFSPAAQIGRSRGAPPALIVRAGLDNAMINRAAESFVKEALEAHCEVELLNHAQGRHGFDILDDTSRTREIISRCLQFALNHLL